MVDQRVSRFYKSEVVLLVKLEAKVKAQMGILQTLKLKFKWNKQKNQRVVYTILNIPKHNKFFWIKQFGIYFQIRRHILD